MMKLITRILFPLCLLFPITTLGETMDDLVEREGIYYKEFDEKRTDVPFTGKVIGEHQGTMRNGEKEGPWVSYHDNGQLSWKGTYQDGKEEGPWVRYYINGQLWSNGTFNQGKLDGPVVGYHDNGQLRLKGTYKDGKPDGPWIAYHDNGQLEWKGTYKDGELVEQ
jgi:antitoxin component YwqK of YwqJK toxin-antitoxin module